MLEVGQRFGRLEILKRLNKKTNNGNYYYKCLCDCGTKKEILGFNLSSGATVSCGCYHAEHNVIVNRTREDRIATGKYSDMYKDKKITFAEFCRSNGVKPGTVYSRLKRGWKIERALSTEPNEDVKARARRNKAKGKKLEKYVVKRLREVFNLDEDDIRPVAASRSGVDIIMTKKARQILPLSIECKNTIDHPGTRALEQAKRNTIEDTCPAVVWHEPNSKYSECVIYFDLQEFLVWYKKHLFVYTGETEEEE